VTVSKEALAQFGLCRRDVRAPLTVLPAEDCQAVSGMLACWQLAPAASI